MKQVIIRTITLENFRNIKQKTFKTPELTRIFAKNGLGKTTILHAISWLLTEKNYFDEANFEIKPIDETGGYIHNLETVVEIVADIIENNSDGSSNRPVALKAKYYENWQNVKMEKEKTLKGHTTDYYIDDVPKKKKDFVSFIEKEIAPVELIKELLNPKYFVQYKDKAARRKRLFELAGELSRNDILAANGELGELIPLLGSRSIEEFKDVANKSRLSLKKDLEAIPGRIDENNKKLCELNIDSLNEQLANLQVELTKVENVLLGESEITPAEEERRAKIADLKQQIKDLEQKAEEEYENQLKSLKKSISDEESDLANLESELQTLGTKRVTEYRNQQNAETEIKTLRNKFDELEKSEYVPSIFVDKAIYCPNCNADITEHFGKEKGESREDYNLRIAEERKAFEEDKKIKLNEFNELGSKLKKDIEVYKENVDNFDKKIEETTVKIEEIKSGIKLSKAKLEAVISSENPYYDYETLGMLDGEVIILESKQPEKPDNNALKQQKEEISGKIKAVEADIVRVNENTKIKKRITELEEEQSNVAQKIADKEKEVWLCDLYMRTEAELYESKINSQFSTMQWKLFETQINGGLKPICEALIDGKPYSAANNAGQINCGIDIINAISEKEQISLPILVDNAESVNELTKTHSQMIVTYVTMNSEMLVLDCMPTALELLTFEIKYLALRNKIEELKHLVKENNIDSKMLVLIGLNKEVIDKLIIK